MRNIKFRAYSKSFNTMFNYDMLQMATAEIVDICNEKLKAIQDIVRSLPEYDNNKFKGKYTVSKYAMQDINEFISECIAESMNKKAKYTSKQVANIIKGDK